MLYRLILVRPQMGRASNGNEFECLRLFELIGKDSAFGSEAYVTHSARRLVAS
jgi:hypothetical protein